MEETDKSYRGWRVVAVCFGLAIVGWGFGFYGLGVYLAQLPKLRGWSLSAVSVGVTGYYLAGALLVAFVSDWFDRFGARTVVAFGALAMGAAVALIGSVTQIWQLYAAFLLMSFGWASMSVGAITNIVGLWFSARRGLAISLALTGASAGGILITPALQYLVGAVGFRPALLAAGALLVSAVAPLAFLLVETPATHVSRGQGAPKAAWTRPRAMKSLGFWSIAGPFSVILTTQVAYLTHQINIFEPVVGREAAGLAVSLTTFMAVLGRLILGAMVDKLDNRLTTTLLAGSQAAALAILAFTHTPAAMFAATALFGLSVGNMITLPQLLLQAEFEAASFGLLVALNTSINQMTYSSGAGLLGLARDFAGSYSAPLAACALLHGVAAASFVLFRPRARVAS